MGSPDRAQGSGKLPPQVQMRTLKHKEEGDLWKEFGKTGDSFLALEKQSSHRLCSLFLSNDGSLYMSNLCF